MTRCTSCSALIKPVVAIDIDGTLADYHSHFSKFAHIWLGDRLVRSHYDGSEPYRDWFCKAFAVDVTTFRAIKLAYRQGGMKRNMPMYPGAPALLEGLRRLGVEIWLTTTRPWERFDRVDPDTREWLRRNRLEYDALLYDENKMDRLAECVDPERVVAVLDDQSDQLAAASAKGWTAIMRVTRYNAADSWQGETVGSLPEAGRRICKEVDQWETK